MTCAASKCGATAPAFEDPWGGLWCSHHIEHCQALNAAMLAGWPALTVGRVAIAGTPEDWRKAARELPTRAIRALVPAIWATVGAGTPEPAPPKRKVGFGAWAR